MAASKRVSHRNPRRWRRVGISAEAKPTAKQNRPQPCQVPVDRQENLGCPDRRRVGFAGEISGEHLPAEKRRQGGYKEQDGIKRGDRLPRRPGEGRPDPDADGCGCREQSHALVDRRGFVSGRQSTDGKETCCRQQESKPLGLNRGVAGQFSQKDPASGCHDGDMAHQSSHGSRSSRSGAGCSLRLFISATRCWNKRSMT